MTIFRSVLAGLPVLLWSFSATGHEDERLELKTSGGGQHTSQDLDPEFSLIGDFYANYILGTDGREYQSGERSGAFMRVLGLHIQSNPDPSTLMKARWSCIPSALRWERPTPRGLRWHLGFP